MASNKEIEKLKRKRSTIKGLCTKLINKIYETLNEEQQPTKEEIEEYLEKLIKNETDLYSVENQIENLIEDLNELESEIETREEHRERIFELKFRLKKKLSEKPETVSYQVCQEGCSELLEKKQNSEFDLKQNVKLPKLVINQYNGNPEAWPEFWAQFCNVIHDNKNLSNIDKFTYLKSYLTGSPLIALEGILMTEKNYDLAIDILKKRYGKTEIIVQCRLNALLNLTPVKSASHLKELRALYDTLQINVRSLHNLGIEIKTYGNLLFPIITKLIPNSIMLEYNRTKIEMDEWDVNHLLDFLKIEVETREKTFCVSNHEIAPSKYSESKNVPGKTFNRYTNEEFKKHSFYKNSTPKVSAFKITVTRCIFCNNNNEHNSNSCPMSVTDKRTSLRKQGICYLCLKRGSHIAKFCNFKYRCENCSEKHNTLLCPKRSPNENQSEALKAIPEDLGTIETNKEKIDPIPSTSNSSAVSANECSIENKFNENEILLQTCPAQITSEFESKICTVLLDNASQSSFIERSLVEKLRLPIIRKEKLLVYPFSCTESKEKIYEVVQFTLSNINNSRKCIAIEALIVETITATPLAVVANESIRQFMDKHYIEQMSYFTAAKRTTPDILLGAEYFWAINEGEKRKITRSLYALQTLFGWTIQGSVKNQLNKKRSTAVMKVECANFDICSFWDLESMGIKPETENCEFDKQLIERAEKGLTFENGRYSTGLLWKLNKKELKNNFGVAKRRFENLKVKLMNDTWVSEQYKGIINDHLEKGIVEECTPSIKEDSYYMPHRSVVRPEKLSSQVRIVYDASSRAENQLSLNDCLLVGPNLNANILDIILKFRIHEIAFCADIEKAFLMIGIHESDRDYLRFLWFPDEPSNDISFKTLRMCRLPFGMSTSPFLLALIIKYHIKKYRNSMIEAVDMLDSSLFVDDLFHGSQSVEQALCLTMNAKQILKEAGMNLRKFATNSKELRKCWAQKGIEPNEELSENVLKVLGIIWNIENDTFQLEVQSLVGCLSYTAATKRNILRTVARIFDPIGLVTPFTVRIKCLLQEIWELGMPWDEILPPKIANQWEIWCTEIQQLNTLTIDRKYSCNLNSEEFQVHIFGDANPKAYGAVAYIRSRDKKGKFTTSFVMSKSRVAPLKRLTLPRLELMGAVVAARIFAYLKTVFEFRKFEVFFWSDSCITLHWIKGSARNWKPFVANRVTEIQSNCDPGCWRYCEGVCNPADKITRGSEISTLISTPLWFHGPSWLSEEEDMWPKSPPSFIENCENEERKSNPERIMIFACPVESPKEPLLNIANYSSILKIFRITAWILRFVSNLRNKNERKFEPLTTEEINEAEIYWVKLSQEEAFKEELNCIRKGEPIPKNSQLSNFDLFLDERGCIRMKGRLQKSKFEDDAKHPILLPSKSRISDLLICQAHQRVKHFGVNDTLVEIRERFWILKGRQRVKTILRRCIPCKRYNARSGSQVIAPLPGDRVDEQPPFAVTGLDFGGPIYVKNSESKHYILLCTCATTRAIHLEVIDSLTTETFLLAFRRFIARRGMCHTIYSDNAKTFHRAELEIRVIWKIINNPEVKDFYSSHHINWKFIVEKAAWWGGFYERMIRSVKTALRKIVGKTSLTKPHLETVLVEIEAIVNSRPLTFVFSDPMEPSPLTPAHFLVGNRLTTLPSVRINTINFQGCTESLVRRFNYRERLLQGFWSRWRKEYLLQLRSAVSSRRTRVNSIQKDDVVLIHDEKHPRNLWKLGRVVEVFPGRDGKIRSCMLRTSTGVLKRPVQLLFPLEVAVAT